MEGHALISPEVLARYAADAARDVAGVAALGESGLHRARGASVREADGSFVVEVNVELEWGSSAAEVGTAIQRSVSDYLEQMAAVAPASVDVLVTGVSSPPAQK
jgi:uncharacterized alkaline shock family protein YloU